MTEIDFDELDKAVSELLNNDSKTSNTAATTKQDGANDTSDLPAEPAKNTPPEPVAQVSGASKEDTPANASSDDPKTPEPAPAAAPAPTVQKRRGMFMDVKPPVMNASKSAAVSRQGATIEPTGGATAKDLTDEPKPEDVTSETPAESPDETAEETEITGGYAPNPAPAQEWPDPIDIAEQSSVPAEEPAAGSQSPEPTAANSSEPPAAISPEPVTIPPAPLQPPVADQAMESPFLADAKVEKRPLGGLAPEAEELESPVAATPQAPLPRELSSDIVSLESDSSNAVESEASPRTEEPKQGAAPEKPDISEPAAAAPAPAESAAEPAKNGAIYDTNAYHPPLLEARVKKKNGWLAVIWILVLLIAGACAGAAYFYLTTQQ